MTINVTASKGLYSVQCLALGVVLVVGVIETKIVWLYDFYIFRFICHFILIFNYYFRQIIYSNEIRLFYVFVSHGALLS